MDLSSEGCRWQERPCPVWGQGIFEKSPYSLIHSYRKIKVWHCFVKKKKQTSQVMWQGLFVELSALWSLTDRHGLKSEPQHWTAL